MYTNYIQAQILAAEALGLVDVASDLKLLLEYIVSDPAQLDMERVSTRISNGTNELFRNTNSGQNNEEAKKKIDLIRKRIVDDELSFEEAAKSFSDEKATKNNGGVLINPTTGDTRFELTKIDPVLYTQIQRLKDNEVSAPLLEQDNAGSSSYKIIKVSNRFDEHVADYSKDFIKIKELALKEKQLNTIQTWMSEKIVETYISVNQDSRECNFANKWLKK